MHKFAYAVGMLRNELTTKNNLRCPMGLVGGDLEGEGVGVADEDEAFGECAAG